MKTRIRINELLNVQGILGGKMDNSFPRLTNRLHQIEFGSNIEKNIEIWRYLSVLENHIFGVKSQYERIKENILMITDRHLFHDSQMASTQISLDVYYYTLTWDKIKKVYNKFKGQMNAIQAQESFSKLFVMDFRIIKKRLDHLLIGINTAARDEYEHPSLEPNEIGDLIGWGNSFINSNGDIKMHVGKNQFSLVQKKEVDVIISIWIDLIDVILKYFSGKPSSHSLINMRNEIEQQIDDIIDEYNSYLQNNKKEDATQVIGQFMKIENYLASEGIPLSRDAITKINSAFFK
jgi:hypothetical protein